MKEQFMRTALLLGEEGVERLGKARVAVFGIGGVGGYTVEALARSGVGHFLLVDSDRVALSNLNRQIIATLDTVERYKTQVMKERILSINPEAEVETRECFFLPENAEEFDFSGLDYVVDAVDTVTAKLELILRARRFGVPVISSMGAGNKLDASRLEVADIYQTSVCPLARVMRRELKARGVDRLKVVYSREEARKPETDNSLPPSDRPEAPAPGSSGSPWRTSCSQKRLHCGQRIRGGRLDADHRHSQLRLLQRRLQGGDKHSPAGQLPVQVRGGVHPATGGAVDAHDAQHCEAVLPVLPDLPDHLSRQLPQPGGSLRLAHGPADAGVLHHHGPLPAFGISPVQPQAAQLRAGHLHHTRLGVQGGLQNLPVGRRHLGSAVGYGVLIQQAVGQENDPPASPVGKHHNSPFSGKDLSPRARSALSADSR